ncbi:outer membrane usher protein [Providencia stuartii]|uniref:outer membrane usher protein n=1 Tax=Providencia TaxID=586 RepID=UPI0027FF04A9|nr:outer membrane usher protein [Providencia sp. 2023EL-00965]ELR5302029.1 outer membrane usher protein [Providencia stuartii]MDV5226085.1 outer membrane usher protein [Providencia rettgeri]MDW7590547.1 outer membrane usher protein [Providencia sp. 2023EL-00965]
MSSSQPIYFRLSSLGLAIIFSMYGLSTPLWATETIEFNTEVLDLEDKNNIDLKQFSRAGYIMPGTYSFTLKVNGEQLSEVSVPFYSPEDDPQASQACISTEIEEQLGLTSSAKKELTWWHDGECLALQSLPGMQVSGDLATSSLYVSIPQAYLEYTAPNWDPPSRWDEGITALMLDYNVNGNATKSYSSNSDSYALNGNGVVGVNLGAWRFRADWQGRLNHITGSGDAVNKDFDWNRFYAYRALPSLAAKLVLGEDYLVSNIFDSFRFIGASVRSELNMLPPNLRGYAPEVTGIAKTNATVIVSQQGRVLYETQVAPGPFRIQDLSDAVSGKLDVTVEEQDGTTQSFQVDTANLPYLTRPGQIQYKFALGQPTNYLRHSEGDSFVTGEFSWGVNNGWSLFGGSLNSKNYNALSLGIGRDLLAFGAISFDITQSFARLPHMGNLNGGSYRINYSKRFESIDSTIQFAGYRFSERDFMSMSDFLNTLKTSQRYGGSKELYTISLNKNFGDLGMSLYLNYNHQTYWDQPDNDYYSIMLSKYIDIGPIKNVSINLSANRSIYNGVNDDSLYLSTSFPLNNGANVGYSLSSSRYDTTNRATYYDRINDRTTYQLSAGSSRKGGTGSAFVTHQADVARLAANVSYMHNQYSAFGLSASGGMTLTPEGGGLHRLNTLGGTRMLVDTDGVSDVPIKGIGAPTTSNMFGKAVVGDVSSYYRNKAQIDLNMLPDNVDAQQSVVQATLTEGAVGYRHFAVVSGQKAMTVLRLPDGSHPPFGAQIQNSKGQNTGIVGDAGSAYISGINPQSVMTVTWGEDKTCQVTFPNQFGSLQDVLLLPCAPTT